MNKLKNSFLAFLSILIMIFSCNEQENISEEPEVSARHIDLDSLLKSESSFPDLEDSVLTTNNLNTFKTLYINKFSIDKKFQKEHIKFPYLEKVYERDEDSGDDKYYEKRVVEKDWLKLDFRYDSSAYYRDYDRYTQSYKMTKDTIYINYAGVDNGIYFGYKFAKDPVWKLVEYWDYSD